MDTENWLHQYRKLDRTDNFQSTSTNFADSRLKFLRNFTFLAHKLFLLNKHDDLISLVQHMLENNIYRDRDILKNASLVHIIAYTLLEIMNDPSAFFDIFGHLFSYSV